MSTFNAECNEWNGFITACHICKKIFVFEYLKKYYISFKFHALERINVLHVKIFLKFAQIPV